MPEWNPRRTLTLCAVLALLIGLGVVLAAWDWSREQINQAAQQGWESARGLLIYLEEPAAPEPAPHPFWQLLARLILSLILGLIIASLYWMVPRKNGDQEAMLTTLVLLTMLIAMVTQVIGESVARAFSLVGALSIVRFRTVVEDTRDTAFVIFAVAIGMAVGVGKPLLPVVGIPTVALAMLIMRLTVRSTAPGPREEVLLQVRLGLGREPEELLGEVFAAHTESWKLLSTATARQGAALDLTYSLRLRPSVSLLALVNALNKVEGLQSVEIRQG